MLLAFLRERGFRFKTLPSRDARCLFYHPQYGAAWPLTLQRPRPGEDWVDRSVIDEMFEAGRKRGVFTPVEDEVKALEVLTLRMLEEAESIDQMDECLNN